MNFKCIDMHCHVFPEKVAAKAVDFLQNYYGFTWEGNGLVTDLLAQNSRADIVRNIIFSTATKPEQVTVINDYIAALVRQNPEQFSGFGTIHRDFERPEEELMRIPELGLCGLKLHPDFQFFAADDPGMFPVYRQAEELGLAVLIHAGDPESDFSRPRRIARIAEKFPRLKLIAAHLGGYSAWDEALDCLIGTRVYIDTSSAIPFAGKELARILILKHGTDRVLFGSDYPSVYPATALRQLQELELPQEDMEKICFRNAQQLFGLPETGA